MEFIKYLWYLLNTINFIKGNVMILLVGGRKGGSGKSTIAMINKHHLLDGLLSDQEINQIRALYIVFKNTMKYIKHLLI